MNPLLQPLEELAESWPHDVEFILDGKADIHLNLCRRCNLERVLRESGLAELLEAGQANYHALMSYQHGNSAPDLAKEATWAWDAAMAKVKGKSA